MIRFLCFIIRCYQKIGSLFFAPSCRFHPSCSHYTLDALQKYGIRKGFTKAFLRIIRCSPFSKGGYDPVR